ncbi:MAG TPA: hypothetical protein VMT37_10110 [Solirubrobacterales bacterium]|nr:hypothetical protein [Solirubrobacterales bacterium]
MKSRLTPAALLILLAVAALCCSAPAALGSEGHYRVLVVYSASGPPMALASQIAAEPDVADVDLTGDEVAVPDRAILETYDLVVDIPDGQFVDQAAYGNALADYLDAGGVLVQFAYDDYGAGAEVQDGPTGRFLSGGYAPLLPGTNTFSLVSLGAYDASSPLMQGVTALSTEYNTVNTLASGATSVARWSDGREAIAYKGRVVAVSAWPGELGGGFSGPYGRLAVNAVRWLGRHTLTVSNLAPAGGTVLSSVDGIDCGSVCAATINDGTQVSLSAKPKAGFAFGGYSGSCAGKACELVVDADEAVTANFLSFGKGAKVKENHKVGRAVLSLQVGGPGRIVLSGKSVERESRTETKKGRVSIPIVARGKAASALTRAGSARVSFKVTYTPTGGVSASLTKGTVLKRGATR